MLAMTNTAYITLWLNLVFAVLALCALQREYYFEKVRVSFKQSEYTVKESAGRVAITIQAARRYYTSFDIKIRASVKQHLRSHVRASSYDFEESIQTVRFSSRQSTATVYIKIKDDNRVEDTEEFQVEILMLRDTYLRQGVRLGNPFKAKVFIKDDDKVIVTKPPATRPPTTRPPSNSTSIFAQFSQQQYMVNESADYALSKVTVSGYIYRKFAISVDAKIFVSSRFQPKAANSYDVRTGVKKLIFNAGVNSLTLKVRIYDDKLVEGTEAFGVQLIIPDHHVKNGVKLGNPSVATVFIKDDDKPATYPPTKPLTTYPPTTRHPTKPPTTHPPTTHPSTKPPTTEAPIEPQMSVRVGFEFGRYKVKESCTLLSVTLVVNGEVIQPFTVGVYPMGFYMLSAIARRDFVPDVLKVNFQPGQSRSSICIVIIDDDIREGTEKFRLLLAIPYSVQALGVWVQHPYYADVLITDDSDDGMGLPVQLPPTGNKRATMCICKPRPTASATPSPTLISSPSPTLIASPSPTLIATPSPTLISSPSPTLIASPSLTLIANPSPTLISSPSPTVISSPSPTVISSPSPTLISSPSPTLISSPSPTLISSPSPTLIASPSPTLISNPSPTKIASPSPTLIVSPSPTLIANPSPTLISSPSLTLISSPSPTLISSPSPTHPTLNITVMFNDSSYSGAEADGAIAVTIVATGVSSMPYNVIITPSELITLSAREVFDYSNDTIVVTFNPGEINKTVLVVVNRDCISEDSEFFNLTLSLDPAAMDLGVTLGDPSVAVAEIEDTDVIEVEFTQSLFSGDESSGMVEVRLMASGFSQWPYDVVVTPIEPDRTSTNTALGNGIDFVSDEVIVTFNPGDAEATAIIPVIRDDVVEMNEFFGLVLSVVNNTDEDGMLFVRTGPTRVAAASIRNSDTSGQSNGIEVAFSERSFTALESSEEITVTIMISGNTQEPFDLNVIPIAKYPLDAEGNGVDFVSSPKLVMVQPGQEEVNVTIDITNDNIAEGMESFCLLLHVPANASEAGVVAGSIACAEAIILDDDMEDNGMNLNKPRRPCDCRNVTKLVSPTRTVCPSIPTATRVTPSPSPIMPSMMVTATPSNGNTSDALSTIQFDVAALDVLEGDGNVTLDIKKTEQVNFDFDVIVIPVPFTADTDDFDFIPQIITFPRDEDTITVQIMLNDDMMLEEKETFAVTLNVTGNVKDVMVGNRNTVMVTIEDNDVVRVQFKNEMFEGYEADGFAQATLVASAPASFPYNVVVIPTNSIPVSAMNATDYDDTPIDVTFSAGNTEVDFRVPITSDSIEEGEETFVLMLEVDVTGVFPSVPLLAQVNIKEQQPVAISFGQSSYFASEAQRFMNVTLVSSVPVDFPYDVVIVTILSNPVSAAGNGVDFVSDSINATFAPQEQQSVVMIPIMEDEMTEDIEYFGIRFRLDETNTLSVVFRSGEITLAVGVILDASADTQISGTSLSVTFNDSGLIINEEISSVDENGNNNLIQIQFDNFTYCANESTGELCTIVNAFGCVKEEFEFGVFPLPTEPISAIGEGVDYDSSPLTVAIPAGDTMVEVCIPITVDDIDEGTEMFYLSLVLETFTPRNVALGPNSFVNAFIID